MVAQGVLVRALMNAACTPRIVPIMTLSRSGCYAKTGSVSRRQFASVLFAPRSISLGQSRTCAAGTSASSLVDKVKEQNDKNKVIVYSKSYCPYCASVKALFKDLNVNFKLIELDELADGADVQDALYSVTGSGTVPQVFVNGNFIGGADATRGKYQSGELQKIFKEAGVSASF